MSTQKIKPIRCKKGTRRNPKTGICEPITSDIQTVFNAQHNMTEEPLENLPVSSIRITEPSVVTTQNKTKKKLKMVSDFSQVPETGLQVMTAQNKTKRHKCPNGYRKNEKTGDCEKKIIQVTGTPNVSEETDITAMEPTTPDENPRPERTPTPLTAAPKAPPTAPSPTGPPKNKTRKKCPKGQFINKKTGLCEQRKIKIIQEQEAEPVVPETEPESEPIPPAEEPFIEEEPPTEEDLAPPFVEPILEESAVPKEKKRFRCPKGMRMNPQTGLCEKRIAQIIENTENPAEDIPNIESIVENKKKITDYENDHNMKIKRKKQKKTSQRELQPNINEILRNKEKKEFDTELASPDTLYDFLYPQLNDPLFNVKIAKRKEFFNTRYDGTNHNVKEHANLLCNAKFELLPHQMFVKNFLSFKTPYNSLLLYHSLGTGKTCSAIGIAEEMRAYMKQVGIKQRILVVASPNVQANFRLQLFDERKLKKIENLSQMGEDTWNMESCIGNSLLKEINPNNTKGMTKEKIISQVNSIINTSYLFMGYGQLANFITEKTKIESEGTFTEKEKNEMEIKKIKQFFNNRLIIIDEAHNIRLTDENNHKKTAMLLMKLARYTDNMRLLLLTATPMYNSYKEIIWMTNLLNLNDKRSIIDTGDIFDRDGSFLQEQTLENGIKKEGGRELLKRKLTGYVSYVRGENPYAFPYRIYPNLFAPESTLLKNKYPTIQMNGKPIDDPLKHLNVYLNMTGDYQKNAYSVIIENLRKKSYHSYNIFGEMREMPSFENMDSFGYTLLQTPIEALNIVYPSHNMDKMIQKYKQSQTDQSAAVAADETVLHTIKEESTIIMSSTGSQGLSNVMKWEEQTNPYPMRHNYDYKPAVLKNYGAIFSQEKLHPYSAKIASICDAIRQSTGIVLIYSQYIDGGVIPMALALEEMGFSRFSSHSSFHKNLFKKRKGEPIDANTMKIRSETVADGEEFHPANYIMITGDKSISPANANDIKYATNSDNKNGEKVKVIIISKAGSEGLDFKNIRQIHILEPWYNLNRIEQIIGRGVRNLSHCQLPFEERNVEIYLHATLLENDKEEAADLYVYRLAEKKAIQIGKVTRLLKESSVDCILNIGQTNFTVDKIQEIAENQHIQLSLSSGKTIDYKIGDNPFTDVCDYMDNCEYKCSPMAEMNPDDLIKDTYNYDHIQVNNERIVERIRELFREQNVYKRETLIQSINIIKQYPLEEIFYALTFLLENKNEYIYDKYGRMGHLINKENYYVFQPIEITDENASIYERTAPVEYKRDSFLMEIPQKISQEEEKEEPAKQEKTKKIQKTVAEEEEEPTEAARRAAETVSSLSEKTIEHIVTNFELVFSKEPVKIDAGEKNWYKHANHVMEHLQVVYGITQEEMEEYTVYHMLDLLLFKEKMDLIHTVYSGSQEPVNSKVMELIKRYFDSRLLRQSGKTAVIINKENGWKIFIETRDAENGGVTWQEGEPEDYKLFDKQIDRYIVDDDKINNIVGFVNMFKNRDMVFKIKDVTQARNNIGARCGDSTTKSDVIKLLNMFLGENVYTTSGTDIYHFGLCVIIEVLMRNYTDKKKDNKIYFLTPEQTIINDIAKFSRV